MASLGTNRGFPMLRSRAVQAQLRGICVVSSASYGLSEANFIEALRVLG